MPYGQDPTAPPEDTSQRRGGYGKDPTTRASTVTEAPGRSAEELFGPGSLPTREIPPSKLDPRGGTSTTATPGSARDIFETGVGQIGRAVADLPSYAGSMVGNFFRALVPDKEGVRAGGRVVSQLGDVGTAATGGLMNPIATVPTAPGLSRGLNIPPPRQAPPPPGPQRLLPPPAIPPAAPTRALPPPSVDIPGRATPTGPGELRPIRPAQTEPGEFRLAGPAPGGTGFAYSPPPPTGAIPAAGATMKPTFAPPPTRPPTAAEAAGAAAGRDLPPRAPGAEGRPPQSDTLAAAERGQPSQLATALASNDPTFPNRALARQHRQIVGRGTAPRSGAQLSAQDMEITTAIDSLIYGRDHVQFRDSRDPTGNTLLPSGRVPENLDEYVQGLDHLKGQVYRDYDRMAGGTAARVDLTPTITRLRRLAADPAQSDLTPKIAEEALQLAERFRERGSYSAQTAQNVVQTLNAQLSSFLKTGKASGEVFSHPTLMNEVRDSLLQSLNGTMERALGDPRYQVLRNRLGSILSIESNVANALSKELSKNPNWRGKAWTATEALAAIHGVVTLGPVKGAIYPAAMEAARILTRYLQNPNRAVKTMFAGRMRELTRPPSFTEQASARLGPMLSPAPPPLPPQPYVGTSGM